MNPILSTLTAGAWSGIAAGLIAVASLGWLDRRNAIHRLLVCSLAIFLMWRYMAWRVFGSLPEMGFTPDFALGVVFVAVEILSMISTTMSLFFLTRIRDRTADVEANLPWLASQPAPHVDVLICTYNEDRLIVEQTIVGAMSIELTRVG